MKLKNSQNSIGNKKMLGMTITQREAEEFIRKEGREEGREEGAIALIRFFKALGTSIDTVISALTQNFPLSGTEAEQLTRLYWK